MSLPNLIPSIRLVWLLRTHDQFVLGTRENVFFVPSVSI